MEKFQPSHWNLVKESNDENIDPYTLVKQCVNFHSGPYDDHKIVKKFFNNQIGTFLSCGANTGIDQSFQLLKSGWAGVYIEPNPVACVELLKQTQNYQQNVTVLNAALFPSTGIKKFNLCLTNSVLSSTKDGWIEQHDNNSSVRSIFVSAITLSDVMAWLNYKVEYVQTDLEGIDSEIINSFDWSLAKSCKMICTEAGPSVLKPLCQQGDFMITDVTATNAFYKRKEYLLN